MPARLTEARSNAPALPQPPGSRSQAAARRARDAFFASFSRELRWSLNSEGRLALVEGAWQSVLGWQPQELHGWYWEELVHPGDHARVQECLRELHSGQGCERDIDLRLALRAGGYHLTTWTFAPGSGVDSTLGLGRDQSAQARAHPLEVEQHNAKLAARIEQLEDRYVSVERFAATAAHQLAEPLVIAESSAILVAEELGEDLDPMLRGRLDAIGRGAARARRLMDALLADARSSGLPLELGPIDLGPLVEATLASLSTQIEERTVSVVVGPLPRALGEPGLLSVVLENLISNALKYGPRSGGRVDISAERRPESWRISVASEGMPIPTDEARRIFQPFHRAPGERRVPGVGLGLTICARLIQRVGGAIGVNPGPSNGNAFWIELRAA
jgi:signal transduction histidine kinase